MGITTFPVVAKGADLSIRKTETTLANIPGFEPGAIYAFKNPSTGQWALIRAIRNGAGLVDQGDTFVDDAASLADYCVIKASTTDGGQPYFRGVALSSMATNAYGYMYIAGYVEKCNLSHSPVTGDMLAMSGSTAGMLTPNKASSIWNGTIGTVTDATLFWPVAIAMGSAATGVSSVRLLSMRW